MMDRDSKLIWEAFDFHNPMKGSFTVDLYQVWYEDYVAGAGGDDYDIEWELYTEYLTIDGERIGKSLFTKDEVDDVLAHLKFEMDTGKNDVEKVIYAGDEVTKYMTAGGNIAYHHNMRKKSGEFSVDRDGNIVTAAERGSYMEDYIDWSSSTRARRALRGLR